MGILDDAIREHLELKRKHGVPEDELQRQEDEALGPARRDVAHQPEDTAAGDGDGALTADEEHAEHSDHAPAEQETALFDMEEPEPEPAPELDQPPAGMEPEEPVAEVPPIDPPPVEPAPVEEPPVEPPPVEPPPVEPPPVAADELADPFVDDPDADARLGDTEPHGFPPVGEDEPEAPGEDPLGSDPEQEDLDVLEDTPDFLQETPEHDRLWFEQKPPRDFDFD